MEKRLQDLLSGICEPDAEAMAAARERQAHLIKPPGSLGTLEDLSVKMAGIFGKVHNHPDKKRVLVFAADNGVLEEGVSCAPQEVTLQIAHYLTRAKAGASVLAKHFGSSISVYDVGIASDFQDPAIVDRKVAHGTQNMVKGPAMTREQALQAILAGAQAVQSWDDDVFGIGEVGIGNTTTSSAVLSVLLGLPAEEVTGRGGGISDEGFARKKAVVRTAIEVNKPDPADVVDVLSKVGGLDIAAMCGAFLGAAASRRAVVIDGFISSVAALCAYRLCPTAAHYFVSSHASYEIGYRRAMEEIGIQPMLMLGMRLGEGSGCPLAFQVIEAACAILNDMPTFEEAEMAEEYLEEIREGDKFTV